MIGIQSFFFCSLGLSKNLTLLRGRVYLDPWSLIIVCIIPAFFSYFVIKSSEFISIFLYINLLTVLLICSFCFLIGRVFFFLVFLEICVIPMSFLIIYMSKDFDKIRSCIFILIINISGSLPFILFSSNLYSSFAWVRQWLSFLDFFLVSNFISLCFVGILLSKLPIFLLHFWLTKAHVARSGRCSILLASIMLKLGSFGILKFSMISLYCFLGFTRHTLGFTLFSSFIFSILIARFFDFKNLVACSSIIHMSFLFPFCLLCKRRRSISSILMIVGHGITSLVLFFIVSLMCERTHGRNLDYSKSSERLRKTFCLCFFLFFCVNFGVPPFINFVREVLIFISLNFVDFLSPLVLVFVLLRFVLFFINALTKNLFGKKVAWSKRDSVLVAGSMPIMSLCVVGLLAICPDSLHKTPLCGSGEKEDIDSSRLVFGLFFFVLSLFYYIHKLLFSVHRKSLFFRHLCIPPTYPLRFEIQFYLSPIL